MVGGVRLRRQPARTHLFAGRKIEHSGDFERVFLVAVVAAVGVEDVVECLDVLAVLADLPGGVGGLATRGGGGGVRRAKSINKRSFTLFD